MVFNFSTISQLYRGMAVYFFVVGNFTC